MNVLFAFACNMVFNFAIGLLVAKFLGPEEYGRFALAHATAIAVQTAGFDWIRLGATRFYSERIRLQEPALRATLDLGFAAITCGLAAGSALLFLSGIHFALSNSLIFLALGIAITNGLFDYFSAMTRARFQDKLFVRLVLVKTLLSFSLMVGGAFWFASAKMTLIGGMLSLAGSVAVTRASLRDSGCNILQARLPVAKALMRYSLPIVMANLLYLAIPLANRSIVAVLYGFSETGQFSLAFDFGSKAIQAVGSALDVVLFQIAVATHDLRGMEEAREKIGNNLAIVIALILPSCTGLWLTLPSLENLIVPEEFRGPFAMLLPLMMTGLFCGAIIQYGINPFFLIAKRTRPLIAAAIIAAATDCLLIFMLPPEDDASSLAIAQAGAMLAALISLIGFASLKAPQWPRGRDLAGIVLANALMSAAILPLRLHDPGLATLVQQVGLGILVYGLVIMGFDTAYLRSTILSRLRPSIEPLKPL